MLRFNQRSWRVCFVVVAVAGLAAACTNHPEATALRRQRAAAVDDADPSLVQLDNVVDQTGKAEVTIDVTDNEYTPKVVRVSPGTKVTWTNQGFNQHNVTPNVDGQFAAIPTGSLDPGTSSDRTFGDAGVYRYYCTIHGSPTKGQRAALVVGS